MLLAEMLALVLLAGVVAYAVLGGADFGGGVWDLFASGPRKEQQREAIAHAMGPVWEANHVWLIFVITLLFTGFPEAFAALSVALFVPWHLVLLGIILRGAAFVFRAYGPDRGPLARRFGRVFGVASLLTPLLLGMTVGAVSSGRLGEGAAWLRAESWAVGALAVAVTAFLAATYLTLETKGALQEDFRRRALASWAAMTLLAWATLGVFFVAAPELWARFARADAVPLVAAASVAGALVLGALWTRRYAAARALAVALVVILLAGWGVLLQHPYLVYPDFPLAEAAAPDSTLLFVLWTLPPGLLVLVPSLWFLFRVFKGHAPGVDQDEPEGAPRP